MGGGRAGIGGAPPSSRTPPPPCKWPLGGARAVYGVVCTSRKQPLRHHGNRHHGGTFTRVSMETAQSLATATPPGGTRALSPRQVFSGGGDRQRKGQGQQSPHIHPRLPVPHPQPATDGKTDGRTHLGTAHVSLTARAGFPWSMGFLKSVRSSSKAIIWGRGVCSSGLGQHFMAPHLSFCEMGIHTWEPDQMELAAKVEKLRPSKGQDLAPCAPNSLEWNLNVLMPNLGHVHDTLTPQQMVSGLPGP